ncbi:MAG: TonB-dependent receptor, partial [Oxalobacteraceae bacterium]
MLSPKSLPTALLGLALVCPALAEAQEVELGQVLIRDQERGGEDQSVEDAKEQLAKVPGGSNVIDLRQPLQGRV